MIDTQKIAERIYNTYKKNLSSLSDKEKIHFMRRAYRATGDLEFSEVIKARALLYTVPSVEKRSAIVEKVINDNTAYPDIKLKVKKNTRLQQRNLFLESRPDIQFYRRYLMDLFQAKLLGLDKSLLSAEWDEYISNLKKVDFNEIYIDEKVVKKVSSFAVNSVFFLSHIGVSQNIKHNFVSFLKTLYLDSEGNPYSDLEKEDYISFIYSLTHVIIAESKYYQSWVEGYDWIIDLFVKELDKILDVCSVDVIAEVGVCFKLTKKDRNFLSSYEKVIDYILYNYNFKESLSPRWLERREHTNCVIMLLFMNVREWRDGPYINSLDDIDTSLSLSGNNYFQAGDAYWPRHISPEAVKDAYGYKVCGYTISLEAWRRGLKVNVDSDGANAFQRYTISSDKKELKFNTSLVNLTTSKALGIVKDKNLTRVLLEESSLPVPKGRKFLKNEGVASLIQFAESIGYPVVLKPLRGKKGIGVFSDLSDSKMLIESYEILTDKMSLEEFILEKHFEGNDYRIVATRNKMLAATKRLPAFVVGDGLSTVSKLIINKNSNRRKNPFLSTGLIKKDEEVMRYIRSAGYSLESILNDGLELRLRGKANASAGGDSVDVTNSIPTEIQAAAIKAVKAIPGLEYGGVDILYDEVSGDFSIIEINGRAQVSLNMYPSIGVGQDIPRCLMDIYFPESPRQHSEINKDIIFDVQSLLDPLIKGVANNVQLNPIKNYKDFTMRKIVFHGCTAILKKDLHVKIKRVFVKYDMIGELFVINDLVEFYIGGEFKHITSFAYDLYNLLGATDKKETLWNGPVKQGVFLN
ncbi:DUF3541 domain-containing protein [Halomonas sp. AOP42-A1-22]|uniref:DUF3541 domain-containing protein n=1 Tax=unclassified Halomonas TaxID=2609666 RepID=UPI0040334AC1